MARRSTARDEGASRTLRAGAPFPPRGDLATLARQGNVIPVCREILADLETPVAAFLQIHRGPYGFLLESDFCDCNPRGILPAAMPQPTFVPPADALKTVARDLRFPSYWPLTRSKTVTVWLAIDDADVENACMRYLPRSHWHGHLTDMLTENDDTNVLNQTVTDAVRFGDPVDVELRAGEVSMHSDLLVHGPVPAEDRQLLLGALNGGSPGPIDLDDPAVAPRLRETVELLLGLPAYMRQ